LLHIAFKFLYNHSYFVRKKDFKYEDILTVLLFNRTTRVAVVWAVLNNVSKTSFACSVWFIGHGRYVCLHSVL